MSPSAFQGLPGQHTAPLLPPGTICASSAPRGAWLGHAAVPTPALSPSSLAQESPKRPWLSRRQGWVWGSPRDLSPGWWGSRSPCQVARHEKKPAEDCAAGQHPERHGAKRGAWRLGGRRELGGEAVSPETRPRWTQTLPVGPRPLCSVGSTHTVELLRGTRQRGYRTDPLQSTTPHSFRCSREHG